MPSAMLNVVLASIAMASMLGTTSARAEPLASRQNAFRIPFRVEPPQTSAQQPVEVQLYVSSDRGATWNLHSRARPDQTHFVFRADRDGEYWFLVRTLDASGRRLPDKAAAPELQVVVDTALPSLELDAVRGPAGEIAVRWRSSDPLLEPHNLRIDYQVAGASEVWQPLAVDPTRTQLASGSCTGEAVLWPRTQGQPLTVRAEICDRAGNRTVAHAQVAAAVAQPSPQEAAVAGSLPNETQQLQTYPATAAAPSPASSVAPSGTPWPVDRQAAAPLSRVAAEPTSVTPFVVQRLPRADAPTATTYPATTSPTTTLATSANPPAPGPWSGAVASDQPIQPPLATVERGEVRPAVPASPASMATVPPTSPPPAAVQPRLVNSRHFQLEYEIGLVGGQGPSKVELWGTRDGGQTWTSYGIDADGVSPASAMVEGEGLYGFRIVVQAAGGRMEYPPRGGDRPELYVAVDCTRPTARITQLQQGVGERSAELLIAWEVQDQALSDRPVGLLYSDRPAGPWTPIATELENTGHYTWRLDGRVPEQVYFRLEARDRAGNLEAVQTTAPTILQRRPPPGRLRDVRPAAETSQAPRTYRFF